MVAVYNDNSDDFVTLIFLNSISCPSIMPSSLFLLDQPSGHHFEQDSGVQRGFVFKIQRQRDVRNDAPFWPQEISMATPISFSNVRICVVSASEGILDSL